MGWLRAVLAAAAAAAGGATLASARAAEVPPPAAADLPALQERLADPDPEVRRQAAALLGGLGGEAIGTAPLLLERLADSAPGVALEAASSLVRIGVEQEPAARLFVRLMQSTVPATRREARETLDRLDAPVLERRLIPLFVRFLGEPEPAAAAEEVLAQLGRASVAALCEAVRGGDFATRRAACRVLERIGPEAAAAVSTLEQALADREPAIRYAAAAALLAVASEPPDDVVPALRQALSDAAAPYRLWGLQQIAGLGPSQRQMLREPAMALLGDPDQAVREAAVRTMLAALPEEVPAGVALLRAQLRSGGTAARRDAAQTLVRLGPAGSGAGPELVALLADPDSGVHAAASAALTEIGQAAVAPLIAALASEDRALRAGVARQLADSPRELAEAAIPELTTLLQEQDGEGRLHAARALAAADRADAGVLAVLIELLNSRQATVIWQAQQALTRLSPEVRRTLLLPALIAALREPDQRLGVAEVLPRVGREAVPSLIAALGDADPAVRFWAADVLGRMGNLAMAAVPALSDATDDPDRAVRDRARSALLRVSPGAAPAVFP